MRRISFFLVVLCILPALTAFDVHADPSRSIQRIKLKTAERAEAPVEAEVALYRASFALVIGIDEYTEKGWPRLSNAVKDARLVARALKAKGFSVDLRLDLTSAQLKTAFEDFFYEKGEDPQARLFVWFAGHGFTLDGEGFIVPADAPDPGKGSLFKRRALSLRRFGEYMRLAEAKHMFWPCSTPAFPAPFSTWAEPGRRRP